MNKKVELENLNLVLSIIEESVKSFEVDPYDYEDSFCQMLDETNEICMGFDPSTILKQCDSTAYRCMLIDFSKNQDITDNQDYKDLKADVSTLQEQIEDLEKEIEEGEYNANINNSN